MTVLATGLLGSPAAGQQPEYYVFHTVPALSEARVYVDDVAVGFTDQSGKLKIRGVEPGIRSVRVVLDGFVRGTGTVEFPADLNAVSLEITPPPPPPSESPVEESARLEFLPVYFLLIAGIIAVASTLLFLWRRNRRRPVSAKRTFSTLTSRVSPLEKAQDEPPNLGPGYRITGLINSGAQGSVFLAESPGGARWAVKVPRLGHGNGLEKHQLQLFLREAELSRRLLDTTNIIPVYAAHVEESGLGRPYYIMEYFDGISLRDYIDRFSPLPPDRAISSIVLRVLSALTYAHGREPGVLHRDLKPENVLVRAEEETGFIHELKIIDFGLSLGQIGTLVGTPPYVAPEIFRGEEPTAASDIFSLGLIFLEMLQDSDLPPFFGESISEMRNRILHEEYDREELPTAVVPLLDRMLAKDPMNRYRSAEQAAYDCQQVYFQMRKVAVGAKS